MAFRADQQGRGTIREGHMKRILSIMACMILTPLAPMTAGAQGGMAAPEYVLSKLRAHDMVFMGTTHRQPSILGLLAEVLP